MASASRAKARLRLLLIEKINEALYAYGESEDSGELGYINDRTAEFMAEAALGVYEHSTYHEGWMVREGHGRPNG